MQNKEWKGAPIAECGQSVCGNAGIGEPGDLAGWKTGEFRSLATFLFLPAPFLFLAGFGLSSPIACSSRVPMESKRFWKKAGIALPRSFPGRVRTGSCGLLLPGWGEKGKGRPAEIEMEAKRSRKIAGAVPIRVACVRPQFFGLPLNKVKQQISGKNGFSTIMENWPGLAACSSGLAKIFALPKTLGVPRKKRKKKEPRRISPAIRMAKAEMPAMAIGNIKEGCETVGQNGAG